MALFGLGGLGGMRQQQGNPQQQGGGILGSSIPRISSFLGMEGEDGNSAAKRQMFLNGFRTQVGQIPTFGEGVPEAAATGFKIQAAKQEQALAEQDRLAAAEAKAKLAEFAMQKVHPSLRSLAESQPELALQMNEQMQPAAPEYDYMNVDGTVVRTDNAGNAVPVGQFGNQPRPMTPEEKVAWGIPATDPNTYALVDGMPKAIGASGITVNNNLSQDKFGDAFGAEIGKQQAGLIDAGRVATSNNIRLGQLEQHLASAPQGVQGAMTQFAGSLGIPVEGVDDVQAAQALINQMVPGQRPAGSGTMSDADLALFKQSLPAIVNQPGGNALIIATTKAINEYTIEQGRIAELLATNQIDLPTAMQMQRAVPNPLAEFSASLGNQPAQPDAGGGWTDMGGGVRIRPKGQ